MRYTFSHRGRNRYYWESIHPISGGESRHELISADTMWYWGNTFDGTQWVHADGTPLSFDEVEALGYDGTLRDAPVWHSTQPTGT